MSCDCLIVQNYIRKLIECFTRAEDFESELDLQLLSSIMQMIRAYMWLMPSICSRAVLLNDNGIFEYILQDDIFEGVLGIMECQSIKQIISSRSRHR